MLQQIHLESLKCFKKLSLPLAPLTLLTGLNAAGKSTALQAPLLLAQALRSGGRSRRISLNGPLVKLGTVAEVVNEHGKDGKKNQVILGAETSDARIIWGLASEERGTSTSIGVVTINALDFKRGKSVKTFLDTGEGAWLLPASSSKPIANLLDTLRSVVFVSAVREGAEEVFPSPDTAEPTYADVGVRGEFAPWWFARNLDEEISTNRHHSADEGTTLRRQVGAWGAELFPGAEANAQFLERTGFVQLQLRTRITDDWRRPANVGYGLTYAFPILVAALLAKAGQVLIIDSPEAHLHPAAQSRMGSFLARIASVGVQIIIETHSDHILNGVRLAVKRGVIDSTQVMVHFFTTVAGENAIRGTQSPNVISAEIDAAGGLSTWPEGFFDQAEKDMSALAGWHSDAPAAR